jgi:hypothetical protein
MTGSFHGPGGRFEVELVLNLFVIFTTANIKRKKVNRIGKENTWSSMTMRKVCLPLSCIHIYANCGALGS